MRVDALGYIDVVAPFLPKDPTVEAHQFAHTDYARSLQQTGLITAFADRFPTQERMPAFHAALSSPPGEVHSALSDPLAYQDHTSPSFLQFLRHHAQRKAAEGTFELRDHYEAVQERFLAESKARQQLIWNNMTADRLSNARELYLFRLLAVKQAEDQAQALIEQSNAEASERRIGFEQQHYELRQTWASLLQDATQAMDQRVADSRFQRMNIASFIQDTQDIAAYVGMLGAQTSPYAQHQAPSQPVSTASTASTSVSSSSSPAVSAAAAVTSARRSQSK